MKLPKTEIEIFEIQIDKDFVNKFSEDEIVFFAQITNLLDEISILQKCAMYSIKDIDEKESVIKSAQAMQMIFFMKQLASKLWEGWQFLQNVYFSRLSKDYTSMLSHDCKEALERLKKAFSKSNNFQDIRNRTTFHFDSQTIRGEIQKLETKDIVPVFLAEESGNCLWAFGGHLMNSYVFQAVPGKSFQEKMDHFVDETQRVAGWFQDFGHEIIKAIIEKHEAKMNVHTVQACLIENVNLPYFVIQKHPTSGSSGN